MCNLCIFYYLQQRLYKEFIMGIKTVKPSHLHEFESDLHEYLDIHWWIQHTDCPFCWLFKHFHLRFIHILHKYCQWRSKLNWKLICLLNWISLGLSIGRNLKLGLGWAYVEFVFFMADLLSHPGLCLGLYFLGFLISLFFYILFT